MGRKKAGAQFNLLDAIDSLEQAKNLSKDYIVESLKASIARAYVKTFLRGWDDVNVRVEIKEDGSISIFSGKTVVENDDAITDDYIQISQNDPLLEGLGLNVGDLYEEEIPLLEIVSSKNGNKFITSFKTSFNARLVDAEKRALVEIYGSKMGELINGRVEQYNKITGECIVNIGKVNVPLEKRDQIGDETFKVGDPVKVCIINVESSQKGAQIRISRSDPLFLRRLFEQEIREIYDGTVIIHNIARFAGVRSKVAVYSNDPNVDACGACIGLNGNRIQAITSNLGNGKEKEKIDVVLYDPCIELYIAESLVPGHVVGLALDTKIDEKTGKEVKHCIAVTRNGEVSTTVGTRGVNVTLAYKLTGYHIDVKQLDDALKEGVNFVGIEEIKAKANAKKIEKDFSEVEANVESTSSVETIDNIDEETIDASIEINESVVEKIDVEEPQAVENIPSKEEVKQPISGDEEVTPVDVVKMDDLLSKLEEEKRELSKSNKSNKKSAFKKKEEKQEVVKEENKKSIQGMAIYTDEELEELKRQEELEDEEESYGVDIDDDYDEYDSDDYYEN